MSQALLSELARIKALFQLRTIALVIGAPLPSLDNRNQPSGEPKSSRFADADCCVEPLVHIGADA